MPNWLHCCQALERQKQHGRRGSGGKLRISWQPEGEKEIGKEGCRQTDKNRKKERDKESERERSSKRACVNRLPSAVLVPSGSPPYWLVPTVSRIDFSQQFVGPQATSLWKHPIDTPICMIYSFLRFFLIQSKLTITYVDWYIYVYSRISCFALFLIQGLTKVPGLVLWLVCRCLLKI